MYHLLLKLSSAGKWFLDPSVLFVSSCSVTFSQSCAGFLWSCHSNLINPLCLHKIRGCLSFRCCHQLTYFLMAFNIFFSFSEFDRFLAPVVAKYSLRALELYLHFSALSYILSSVLIFCFKNQVTFAISLQYILYNSCSPAFLGIHVAFLIDLSFMDCICNSWVILGCHSEFWWIRKFQICNTLETMNCVQAGCNYYFSDWLLNCPCSSGMHT